MTRCSRKRRFGTPIDGQNERRGFSSILCILRILYVNISFIITIYILANPTFVLTTYLKPQSSQRLHLICDVFTRSLYGIMRYRCTYTSGVYYTYIIYLYILCILRNQDHKIPTVHGWARFHEIQRLTFCAVELSFSYSTCFTYFTDINPQNSHGDKRLEQKGSKFIINFFLHHNFNL